MKSVLVVAGLVAGLFVADVANATGPFARVRARLAAPVVVNKVQRVKVVEQPVVVQQVQKVQRVVVNDYVPQRVVRRVRVVEQPVVERVVRNYNNVEFVEVPRRAVTVERVVSPFSYGGGVGVDVGRVRVRVK